MKKLFTSALILLATISFSQAVGTYASPVRPNAMDRVIQDQQRQKEIQSFSRQYSPKESPVNYDKMIPAIGKRYIDQANLVLEDYGFLFRKRYDREKAIQNVWKNDNGDVFIIMDFKKPDYDTTNGKITKYYRRQFVISTENKKLFDYYLTAIKKDDDYIRTDVNDRNTFDVYFTYRRSWELFQRFRYNDDDDRYEVYMQITTNGFGY
ncbi:MAG: hypothetical protein H7Y07_08015 [Pyrinomonadaceae bacterium]|nr:hypothetical protein [Sphingobacteriaceae bacterium]